MKKGKPYYKDELDPKCYVRYETRLPAWPWWLLFFFIIVFAISIFLTYEEDRLNKQICQKWYNEGYSDGYELGYKEGYGDAFIDFSEKMYERQK